MGIIYNLENFFPVQKKFQIITQMEGAVEREKKGLLVNNI